MAQLNPQTESQNVKGPVTAGTTFNGIFEAYPPQGKLVESSDFVVMSVTPPSGNSRTVGAVQSMNITEDRPINWIYEIGNIRAIDYTFGNYHGTLTVNRAVIFADELYDALGYYNSSVRLGVPLEAASTGNTSNRIFNLSEILIPLDISAIINLPPANGIYYHLIKTYKNCMITHMGYNYQVAANRVVIEAATFTFNDIQVTYSQGTTATQPLLLSGNLTSVA